MVLTGIFPRAVHKNRDNYKHLILRALVDAKVWHKLRERNGISSSHTRNATYSSCIWVGIKVK